MRKQISVREGNGCQSIGIESDRILFEQRYSDFTEIQDVPKAIVACIEDPIGCPPLKEMLSSSGAKSVLLLVDDDTRATPQHLILPVLINKLNEYGICDDEIKILFCLGTHRRLDPASMERRVGPEVYRRIECTNLDQKSDAFISFGKTKSGTPIELNRYALSFDFKIAIGNIIPHMYAGWAGGAKMIQPGITSSATTAETHLLAAANINGILGNPDNPVRLEMEEIARIAGLDFIINTVLDTQHRVIGIVGGDCVKAHRRGVELARPIYTIEYPERADLVIAGATPSDRDLWQGFKPLNNCGITVRDGGVLILVISAPEGIAPDHRELEAFGTIGTDAVLERLKAGLVKDRVAAATYMAFWNTARRIRVILVSEGISDADAQKIGIRATDTIDRAYEMALELLGIDDPTIGVIPFGADVIPVLR